MKKRKASPAAAPELLELNRETLRTITGGDEEPPRVPMSIICNIPRLPLPLPGRITRTTSGIFTLCNQ